LYSFVPIKTSKTTEPSIPETQTSAQHSTIPNYLGFGHIYVINLKKRPEKLAHMRRCLELLHVNYTVFEALDAKSLGWTSTQAITTSHINVLKEALSKNYPDVLVFEDDVDFDFSAALIIPIAKNQLPKEWDYLSLYCNRATGPCDGIAISHYIHKIRPDTNPQLYAVGRALSRKGMQKIVAGLTDLTSPSDVFEGQMIIKKELEAYMMKHPLVIDQ
jgi:GR25 family glycosyltransferase involved in LPS biosynthesis